VGKKLFLAIATSGVARNSH